MTRATNQCLHVSIIESGEILQLCTILKVFQLALLLSKLINIYMTASKVQYCEVLSFFVALSHTHTYTQVTFILKNVMLVRRSTVDFRSWRRSGFPAGKLSFKRESDREKRKITLSQAHILESSILTPLHIHITLFSQNIEIDYWVTPSNHKEMTVCLIV